MLSRVRWRVFAVQNSQACYDHLLKLNTQWRISIKNSVNGNLHHITVYVLSFAKCRLSLLDFPYFISVILLTHFNSGRNRACYKVSHNAWFRNSYLYFVNDGTYDFSNSGFPFQNCIVGMLLTCPIAMITSLNIILISRLRKWIFDKAYQAAA